ncbi:hypothetical protein [Pseudonocardia sp. T1-2H]
MAGVLRAPEHRPPDHRLADPTGDKIHTGLQVAPRTLRPLIVA